MPRMPKKKEIMLELAFRRSEGKFQYLTGVTNGQHVSTAPILKEDGDLVTTRECIYKIMSWR